MKKEEFCGGETDSGRGTSDEDGFAVETERKGEKVWVGSKAFLKF